MTNESVFLLTGVAFISLGAFIDGSLGLALKYTKGWQWDHLWLVYSILAFLVIPWILAFATIKNLPEVLRLPNVVTCS